MLDVVLALVCFGAVFIIPLAIITEVYDIFFSD